MQVELTTIYLKNFQKIFFINKHVGIAHSKFVRTTAYYSINNL